MGNWVIYSNHIDFVEAIKRETYNENHLIISDVESDLTKKCEDFEKKYGSADVLIIDSKEKKELGVLDASYQQINELFEKNVFNGLKVIQTFLPSMRKKKSGLIITVSSIEGFENNTGIYGATEYSVHGYSISMGKELKPLGIKVCCIMPDDDFYNNPSEAAKSIIQLTKKDEIPLNLFIGKKSLEIAKDKMDYYEAQLADYKALSRSVDINDRYRDMKEIKKWSVTDEK